MTTVPRHGDIEIEQDLAFQRRDWRAQRAGRVVMAIILIAAVAGIFGNGPLASASVRTDDGRLRVDYDRIARHGAPHPLFIHFGGRTATDSVVDLWVDERYMRGLVVNEISPAPSDTRLGDGRLIYRFRLADLPRSATIVFHVDGEEFGLRRGALGLVNGDSVRFRQFVFP